METAPHGVVSLFDMLEFSACDYVEISYHFGMMLGRFSGQEAPEGTVGKLLSEANRLGLSVTREVLSEFILEMQKASTTRFSQGKEGPVLHLENIKLDNARWAHHIESVFSTFKAELKSILFRIIPSGKAKYCQPDWLVDSPIYRQFPNAWKEFQSAGRCYAYGENTASAFHLSRALEWGLKSLAVHLGKPFDRNSWDSHLKDIDRELANRYAAAGPRTEEEKFYSEAAAEFGHMKIAWRNPTMHIEAKYDEGEAQYLLTTVEKFISHLSSHGLGE